MLLYCLLSSNPFLNKIAYIQHKETFIRIDHRSLGSGQKELECGLVRIMQAGLPRPWWLSEAPQRSWAGAPLLHSTYQLWLTATNHIGSIWEILAHLFQIVHLAILTEIDYL